MSNSDHGKQEKEGKRDNEEGEDDDDEKMAEEQSSSDQSEGLTTGKWNSLQEFQKLSFTNYWSCLS